MTEEEIISCLKENKHKGITFAFMPDDVQAWCKQHRDEKIFTVYRGNTWDVDSCICCNYNGIYSLPSGYEIKPKFKPHWEEFNVDEHGKFMIQHESMDCVACLYPYWNWNGFLSDNNDKYNAFGGWFYGQDKTWNLALQVQSASSSLVLCAAEQQKVAPVTPTKIRFWRYKE